MDTRSDQLLNIRPLLRSAKVYENTSDAEYFQNITLRPIIKFQNNLLLAVFKNYIRKHKNTYHSLSQENKLRYIENAIQKDIKFRNSLKGMLIGQFSIEEYERYTKNSSAFNKRMMNMVIERLKDQMLVFEEEVLVP